MNWNDALDHAKMSHVLKLTDTRRVNKDSTKHGTAVWSNHEVVQLLEAYGLPGDSPLSVLVVEFLPTITNFRDHVREPGQAEVRDMVIDVYREIISSRSDLIAFPHSCSSRRDRCRRRSVGQVRSRKDWASVASCGHRH